jgi:LAGLIDADG endonuclease
MVNVLRCLRIIRQRFGGCGYVKSNGRRDRALVYVVRRRTDLLEHVIPFFEESPLLSSKQEDFEKFAAIVRAMECGIHRTPRGFSRLLDDALSMNGNGRFRQVRWRQLCP